MLKLELVLGGRLARSRRLMAQKAPLGGPDFQQESRESGASVDPLAQELVSVAQGVDLEVEGMAAHCRRGLESGHPRPRP